MQPHSSEVSESRIADRDENAYVCAGRIGLSNLKGHARRFERARGQGIVRVAKSILRFRGDSKGKLSYG